MSTTADKKDTGVWGETCPVALFRTRKPDWNAFADASVTGYKRAQHRFIGTGASGKADPLSIPPGNFTLSIMYVPVGEGNAPHTHEVEEVFFVLQGHMQVFWDDENGERQETRLGPWDCVLCRPTWCTASTTTAWSPATCRSCWASPPPTS